MNPDLARYLDERRALIEDKLPRCLPSPPACPAIVADAMRYSLMAGGKRLRPILTLAAAEAVGRSEDAVRASLAAACAIEIIHTYSLIHDDLPAMDDDTMRRGRPTLHVVYGEGIAILAGDGLLTEAFALMSREPETASTGDPLVARKLRAIGRVAAAAGATGMVGGQAIDLKSADDPQAMSDDNLRAMHAMKTGALIRAAAVSGAIMAGGSDEAIDAIDAFGTELGLAFQITDDILDVEATSAQLGKTKGKDAKLGKPTYVSRFGLGAAHRMAADCITRARAILDAARLSDGHLPGIAEWVTERRA